MRRVVLCRGTGVGWIEQARLHRRHLLPSMPRAAQGDGAEVTLVEPETLWRSCTKTSIV